MVLFISEIYMENNNYNSYTYSDEEEEIRLGSLIKKMLSHTKLMIVTVLIAVVLSFIYAYVIYEPAYNVSATYTYEIKENTTFSNLYGVKYKTLKQVEKTISHYDTIDAFIKEKGLDPKKYNTEKFLSSTSISTSNNDNSINVSFSKMSEESIEIQKEYIEYAVSSINNEMRSTLLPELNSTKSIIEEDINELSNLSFKTEETSNTNYQKINSLKDNIKAIDIQVAQINSDAIKLSSEYMQTKVSSRGKTMIIIVLVSIVIGAAIDFFMSFFDNHIYFSTDITDIPYLDDHLISCIPLYKNNEVSGKEFEYILNKLKGKNHIAVTSISCENNSSFADNLKKAAERNNITIELSSLPSLEKDPNILSSFDNSDIALVILKAGENTVEEAKNFARDCSLIGAENYFFVVNGINVSDPMVTRFERDSKYIHYNIFKFRTYREHYKKYLG